MNQTLCNGKFIFKDTRDKKDITEDRKWDKEHKAKHTQEEIARSSRNTAINRRIKKAVFRYLELNGYKVTFEETMDGYFIFDMGKETVVHFKLKGFWLKDYLFGMWINPDNYFHKPYGEMNEDERKKYNALSEDAKREYYTVVEIFQQHEDYIDKFKPSRSSPVVEISMNGTRDLIRDAENKDTKADGFSYEVDHLKDLIHFMEKHPFFHFSGLLGHDGIYLASAIDDCCLRHPIFYFIKTRTRFYWKKFNTYMKKKIGFHKAWKACLGLANEPCVKEVKMVKFNPCIMEGCTTSHDYEIRIRFTKESTLKECSEAFDRHVKTCDIGMHTDYDCVAEVMAGQCDIQKDCDYTDRNGVHYDTMYIMNCYGIKDEEKDFDKFVRWYTDNCNKLKGKKLDDFKKKYPTVEDYCDVHDYDYETHRYYRMLVVYDEKAENFPIIEVFDHE